MKEQASANRRVMILALLFWALTLISFVVLDNPAERFIRPLGKVGWAGVFARTGAWEFLIPFVVFSALYVMVKLRSTALAGFVVTSYVLSAVATSVVKTAVARPEPLDKIGDLAASFPSGHTTQAAAVFTSLWIVFLVMKSRYATIVGWSAVVLAANTGIMLFIRNAHWVSDFFVGYAIGLTAVVVSFNLWSRLEPQLPDFAGKPAKK